MKRAEKKQVISSHKVHDKDTWSVPVQVAILTTRINELVEHLKVHKKDNHSRVWLIKMVERRRKLLSYLKSRKPEDYDALIKKLKLRK